jgi:hypothetical protein
VQNCENTGGFQSGIVNNRIFKLKIYGLYKILGYQYRSYARALTLTSLTLSVRRQDINLKFAQKALKSEKYKTWFCKFNPTEHVSKTRSVNNNLCVPVDARTKAFREISPSLSNQITQW